MPQNFFQKVRNMQVKVLLKRKVRKEAITQLTPLLIQLRNMAMQQPGYVSGETLINLDDPEECLVISTWKSKEEWDAWLDSDRRKELQAIVDSILGEQTYYQVYAN
jgi:heme oxygenase (mycobilin-producing)